MKNILLFIVVALTIISCQKQIPVAEEKTTDLGYGAFKYGEVVYTLYGGQNIEVGTVTVGIDDDTDYIYIKYETFDGWYIEETHVFVGTDGSQIPVNKPGDPKIGHFPFSTSHSYGDGTNVVTYPTIPYVTGQAFVLATHAVVYTLDGQEETAWSWNADATKFSGKRWGWFLNFSFNGIPPSQVSYLYISEYVNGYLNIYQVKLLTGETTLISREEFDAGIDGSSWDPESNMFIFLSESGNELWGSNFNQDEAASLIGNLNIVAIDGTLFENTYYIIDESNRIWTITLDADLQQIIGNATLIGEIDANLDVVDIAMNPEGQLLYIVVKNSSVTQLLVYNINDNTYSSLANLGNVNYQIAFDRDGNLHAIEETPEDENSIIHELNENTGELGSSIGVNVDVVQVATAPRI